MTQDAQADGINDASATIFREAKALAVSMGDPDMCVVILLHAASDAVAEIFDQGTQPGEVASTINIATRILSERILLRYHLKKKGKPA